jgi:predicted component of type VI protein secretion system
MGCSMPAQLVALSEGRSILLDKPILLIGRHPECDIPIDSRKISRRHCCIAQVSDYLVIRDLGSTNGIRINGVRVLEGRLKAGDELTIGGLRYQVSWDVLPGSGPHGDADMRQKVEREGPGQAIAPDEDDLLEACDEPIPLADPAARKPPHGAHKPPSPPFPLPPGKGRDVEQSPPPAFPDLQRSVIIPEDLGLAPASDMEVRSRPPAP